MRTLGSGKTIDQWKASQDLAHRGYPIKRVSFATEERAISKDGYHICYAKDLDAAKRSIDELLD